MATKRSYGPGCAVTHALDLVGERWALLVVRELLLGPKRFTDLRAGLPHASPNVVAQRLRELERNGVVRRRKLGPPAGTWVYELTEWGLELEPVVISLGRWGARSPLPRDADVGADSLMLALKAIFDPEAADELRATCELRFGEDRFTVRIADGLLDVAREEAPSPDAVIETDADTFAAVLTRRMRLDKAQRTGRLKLTGDAAVVERVMETFRTPEPAPAPSV